MFVRSLTLCAVLLPLATSAHAGRPKLKKLDVASLSVEAFDGLCAGTTTQLTGVATLNDGTVLRSRTPDGSKGELRPNDLKLSADPKVDGSDQVFVENTGRALVGTSLPVTVEGRGTELVATAELPLHFRCQVGLDYTAEGTAGAPWTPPRAETRDPAKVGLDDVGQVFLPAAMLAQAARDVKEARPLLAGAGGASGDTGTGARGGDGGPGQPGPSGHDLVVELSDLGGLVLARIEDTTDGSVREAVVDPAGGSLHLVTRGGRGGQGGRGGNGGESGKQSQNQHAAQDCQTQNGHRVGKPQHRPGF